MNLEDSQNMDELYMLGYVLVNVVGIQYCSGSITGREMVALVRDPLNPHDENAIKVLNSRGTHVGFVERSAAAVLAPSIDSGLIKVEGIVPIYGVKRDRYRLPCQVHIFTRLDAFPFVKEEVSRSGLKMSWHDSPSITLSKAVAVTEGCGTACMKSVDDVFKLVDENVSKKTAMEVLEPPKGIIKTELLAHQKEALGWLVKRENSSQLPPFWVVNNDKYVNELTNFETDVRPSPIRGGIFADDMGLGKTLTLISLIALDNCGSGEGVDVDLRVKDVDGEAVEMVGVGDKKRKRWSKIGASGSRKKCVKESFDGHRSVDTVGSKTTIVVCPTSVLSTWVSQLCDHTHKGSMNLYLYHGERTRDVEELKKYDVVLTTYSTVGAEEGEPWSPLGKMKWWRIILDEAHVIKNVNAKQTRAVTWLEAERRWAVTGTPIQNSPLDLFSLMVFLRFAPFSDRNYWDNLITCPLARGSRKALSRLQVLMATVTLRRTKDHILVHVPQKVIETCYVELSPEERQFYDQVEEEAKNIVKSYIADNNIRRNYSAVLSLILRLRQICTDMALCPDDLKSLLSVTIEDASKNPDLLEKMISLLQDGEDFDCPICICPPSNAIITCCAHIFCRGCILKTLKCGKSCCPMCRNPLTESDIFASPPEASDTGIEGTSSTTLSSKGSLLLKLLTEMRNENPTAKSVVFSQFRKMLSLLQDPLKASGFKVLLLDGSMTAKRRANVIEEFNNPGPDAPTVLLASLKASGAGINLTAASTVYLLEPWWNPAVEEQAMDRVHRIGQKETVKVVKMIAKNTIEERVLRLQERKRILAKESIGRKDLTKEVNIDDVLSLMSLLVALSVLPYYGVAADNHCMAFSIMGLYIMIPQPRL